MNNWIAFFIILGSVAMAAQSICVIAAFVFITRRATLLEKMTREVLAVLKPIPPRIQALIDQLQVRVPAILTEAEHITHSARLDVQHADRVITDAVDRFHGQVDHLDHILTSAFDTVEQAGSAVRREVSKPVHVAVALVRGLQAGFRSYRGNHRESASGFDPWESHS